MLSRRELMAGAIGAAGVACLPAESWEDVSYHVLEMAKNLRGMDRPTVLVTEPSGVLKRFFQMRSVTLIVEECQIFNSVQYGRELGVTGWISGHRAVAFNNGSGWKLSTLALVKDPEYANKV